MSQQRGIAHAGERGVDIGKLWMVEFPNESERAVLELAREIERSRNPNYAAVSFGAQEEAGRYYNEHGFVRTLNHMLELRAQNEERS